MGYYTTIGKVDYCPYLKMNVSLTGKYNLIGDRCEAKFSYATCSVVENSIKPTFEQDESIKYLKCPQSGNCEVLDNFENGINLKKYGL